MVTGQEIKTEQKQFNYELVLIFRPELAEEALEPAIANISQIITGKGDVVTEVLRWGKKKLAYPIKHLMEGTYVVIHFKADPAHNKELDSNLKISEKILRYLLVNLDQ